MYPYISYNFVSYLSKTEIKKKNSNCKNTKAGNPKYYMMSVTHAKRLQHSLIKIYIVFHYNFPLHIIPFSPP